MGPESRITLIPFVPDTPWEKFPNVSSRIFRRRTGWGSPVQCRLPFHFTVSCQTFNRDILLEVTRPFNPSFIAFLNQYLLYADQLCITTRYLSSILQDLTGHTPKELIDARCIQEIKMLLRTTNLTMQEIALRLDFPDQSFFSRYFKKNTGMTPAEYRAARH